MRIQDYMVEATRTAAKEAFRYAKAVPDDKIEWQPDGMGRSVLDLCRELAMCPAWAVDTINGVEHKFDDEAFAAIKLEQQQWKTPAECEEECDKRLEQLFDLFRNLPDERLKDTRWLPYDGGRDFTVAEMMEYPRWNFTYHLGQIAYIQILYGDKEMH